MSGPQQLTSPENPPSGVPPRPQLLFPNTRPTQTDQDAFGAETWLSCRSWQDMLQTEEGPSRGHGWWLPPKARPAPKDQVGSPQTHLTMSRSPPPGTIPTRTCSPKRPLFKICCAIQFICFKKKKKKSRKKNGLKGRKNYTDQFESRFLLLNS